MRKISQRISGTGPLVLFSRLTMALEAFENGLSGEDALVLGFFEDGDAAEIRVGKEKAGIGARFAARQAAALFGKNGADGGANHGVAHAHDVDAGYALADVGVDALEVAENSLFPVVPIPVEQQLAVFGGRAFGESPVKRPHRAVDVGAQALVHGVDVAERRRIEKDGVPGGLRATGIRKALESQIGGKPRRVDEIVEAGKPFDEIGSEKSGCGENYEIGQKSGVAGEDADAAFCFRDAMDHLIDTDVFADPFQKAAGDPAIAFGPSERAFFFHFAGREIVDAGPGGSVPGECAVIVAAGVVHVPVDEPRIRTLLLEPIGEREAVQILKLCRAAEFEWDRECAAGAEVCEEIFKVLELVAIFLREADGGFETFLPTAVEEKALLRREAEVALFPLAILEDAEVFEEFADVFGLSAGNGNVVGGPGIGGDFVFPPAGVAAGLRIHFEEDEIGEAAFRETPGGAETGDAAANDNDGKSFGAFRRREGSAVAQEMAHLKGIVDER